MAAPLSLSLSAVYRKTEQFLKYFFFFFFSSLFSPGLRRLEISCAHAENFIPYLFTVNIR